MILMAAFAVKSMSSPPWYGYLKVAGLIEEPSMHGKRDPILPRKQAHAVMVQMSLDLLHPEVKWEKHVRPCLRRRMTTVRSMDTDFSPSET